MKMIVAGLASSLFWLFSVAVQATEETVEIMLESKLDDERGYCLDIAGGKGANAPLDKGLQAHTCYHYTGSILEDQGFDQDPIGVGQFRIPYFDVCMEVESSEPGAAIVLGPCAELDTQRFTLKPGGHLVTEADENLCITVSDTEKREGRGGSPVHVMRPVSLQVCDESKKEYQTWTINRL